MKKLFPIVVVITLFFALIQTGGFSSFNAPTLYQSDNSKVHKAFVDRQSDIQVRGSGQVVRILSDDIQGSKHQRFILKLNSGVTVLVAHNIDLAPRINHLKTGSNVEFYGEYEWNKKGGVVHWTHHDPAGRHPDGWLKHQGRLYQ